MKNLIEFAQSTLYGIREIRGNADNPLIIKMFHEIGHKWVKHDEMAWCAAAHGWILKKNGYQQTGKLNARSYENFGKELKTPVYGCTVVFWRVSKTSGYGHVGFFIREQDGYVWVLGGNQSDQYKISRYSKEQVLSYREMLKVTI